ncbi:protein argonaute-2-like isoform X2 [Dermacentor silvarum]|uniref:protein argonaute-2-like isoform X2 n=1 Tax=Dermacentor silvarum TaxID=543639 RepID=UPI002101D24B|nr:protein argonaute-2-like isoform X2 [Dermacentor silvarum]
MERGGKRGGGKRGGGPGRGPARGRGRGRDDQPGQEPPRPGEGQDVSFMQSMQQRAAQAAQQQPQAPQQQQPQAAQPQAQRGGGVQRRGGKRAPAAAQQMAPGAVAAGEPLDMGAVQKALPPVPEMAVVPKRTAFPQRPKHGQLGRAIQLVANHFEIELPHGDVYHYDVAIVSPSKKEEAKAPDQKKMRCLSTRINRLVIQNLVAKYRGELNKCLPAFDGRKNLYTRKPLPFKERTFKVPFQEGDREQEFIVTVQYAATVSLDALHAVYDRHVRTVPQEVIQALDIIMRHGPCVTLTPVGRSIFMPPAPGDNSELGGGHEVWFGYYTSVRPAQWKPMLNIDRSATAFYEAIPVIEFMCKLLSEGPAGAPYQRPENFRRLTASQCIKLSKELKDLRVRVLHLSYPRKYKVAKVTQLSAQELNFNLDAGTKTNVAEYFRQKYPKYMRYPNLPCIQAGTPNRPVYLPLEACHIVEGQPYRKKLSESMTTEMIRRTAQPPAQRFRSIMSSVRDVVDKSRPYLDEFGIKVSTNPTQLKGRVLDPPSLTFGGEQTLRPRDGVWDLRNSRLLAAKAIDKWALLGVNCRLDPGAINNMVHLFKDIGGKLGMMVKDPLFARSEPTGRTPIVKVLKELKDNKVELVIIVLGRQASYADIKEAAEVKLGIRTQCIKEFNMTRKCNPALITNLCLKINAKLGGTNNGLLSQEKPAIFKEPVIIIGADVTHPAPGDRVKPSIAACVGSMDSIPSRYQASIRVQIQKEEAVARVEIIEDLKDMIKELLKAFYLETRHKPVRIIFYRDGVSEGQFGIVRDQELSAIRQACLELSPDGSYKPPVTFIVVQKRHHTRFMPANERDGVGRAKNIPPGTTVDTVVTHPVDFDFFLCSHAGIQGTSKPAHYYVVHDDANFTSDDLQKLSYYLCHTYARCARSVSIPAPVYYAHLAAFRAKEHIASACNISSGSSVSSAGSDSVSTEQYVSAVKVTEAMQKHMYFV